MFQSLILIAAAAAAALAAPAFAQNLAPPADLHPPINLDADTLRSRFSTSNLGLKPSTIKNAPATGLPFGIDYNREVKSFMVPIDEKNEWGVGVGLNLNASKIIELSPGSVLGLQQPNRAPGVTFHKKF
ncbi:MAG: hypothetical protein JWN94_4402 [Betaproteobacteria bacterium]|nr:hypothetical protein [Betaproteobacteria bacterium]